MKYHGVNCLWCGHRWSTSKRDFRTSCGEKLLDCPECGGVMIVEVISYLYLSEYNSEEKVGD